MSRSRRGRLFAAPLVLTFVGACGGGQQELPPNVNPGPPPLYGEWMVAKQADGECIAESQHEMSCPEGAHCNPPQPAPIECPEGIGDREQRRVYQQSADEPCLAEPPAICDDDCVVKATPCPE